MSDAKKTPKWRRRADARPDEVLDAALELFISSGFSATRVEDIARRAGLSKGAVYLYFESKEAIFSALVRRAIVPMAKHAVTISANRTADPSETIRLLVRTIAGRLADRRFSAIPRIVLAEAGNFPELARMYRHEVIERGFGALETLIRRGIEKGDFRPIQPAQAVRNIVGPILAQVILTNVFGFDEPDDPDAFVENHLDIVMNGLAARPAGERP